MLAHCLQHSHQNLMVRALTHATAIRSVRTVPVSASRSRWHLISSWNCPHRNHCAWLTETRQKPGSYRSEWDSDDLIDDVRMGIRAFTSVGVALLLICLFLRTSEHSTFPDSTIIPTNGTKVSDGRAYGPHWAHLAPRKCVIDFCFRTLNLASLLGVPALFSTTLKGTNAHSKHMPKQSNRLFAPRQ